jgi:hypothetical protein
MPGAVLAAAILLMLFAGVAGLALAVLGGLQMGDNDFGLGVVLVGLLMIAFTGTAVWAMTRGDRGGQVVAVIFGAFMGVGGLVGLGQGQAIGALWLCVGVAVVVLVVAPVSSRGWFAG